MSGIGKSIEAERQKSSLTAQREEEEEIGYGYGVSFSEVRKMFWSQLVLMVTQDCECTKIH